MLALTLPVSLFALVGVVMLSFFLGFIVRGGQLKKSRKRVIDLETEMLSNHADILQLQKEKAHLEQTLKSLSIPVIPMINKQDEKKTNIVDVPMRKQLLQQPQPIKKHS